ncbi:acyl carrier protein [Streptomyces sp. NPDC127068]|uniref:acyl carrier protein n=1 Tax=Streptomyces sp. NPDC127068 TaxID=3347127 RepID=UPI003658A9A1
MYTYLTTLLTGQYQVACEIEPTATLAELGLDSLLVAELGADLQDALDVPIEDGDITLSTTAEQLAALLEAKGAKATQ